MSKQMGMFEAHVNLSLPSDVVHTSVMRKKQLERMIKSSRFMLRPVKEGISIPVCKIERSMDANNVIRMVLDSLAVCDLSVQECFGVMSLNRNNTVISCDVLFVGGFQGVVADVKMIVKCALLNGASGMIVFHNHPSGNMSPSQEDMKMTQKIRRVGVDLELPLLDHIILAPNGSYYSFADEGTLDNG